MKTLSDYIGEAGMARIEAAMKGKKAEEVPMAGAVAVFSEMALKIEDLRRDVDSLLAMVAELESATSKGRA